eukprot:758948-Hanusia_phi.AAC.1
MRCSRSSTSGSGRDHWLRGTMAGSQSKSDCRDRSGIARRGDEGLALIPHRRDETQRRMRGAPVATAAAADEDEGDVVLVEKVEAIGLCIAVGDYESLPQLDKALPDSRAFVERLASRPRCLGYECSNPTETNLLTFLKRLMRELSSSPPSMLIIFYTGHVVREA